jgi:phosphoribosyl-ATP pyrophosphohydrolase/phosphoribosyl-AMP cyclohydrolase
VLDLDTLDFEKGNGLVTVVAQDARTGVVLMVAHADREALQRTIQSGEMHYRSRARGPWHKGAISGNTQRVLSLTIDCDGDAVLARVIPAGPACHQGTTSCFAGDALAPDALAVLDRIIFERSEQDDIDPASYTRRLLQDRNLRLKKIGEEATEFVTASADGDVVRAREEMADLIYHSLVALRAVGGTLEDVQILLSERQSAPRRS